MSSSATVSYPWTAKAGSSSMMSSGDFSNLSRSVELRLSTCSRVIASVTACSVPSLRYRLPAKEKRPGEHSPGPLVSVPTVLRADAAGAVGFVPLRAPVRRRRGRSPTGSVATTTRANQTKSDSRHRASIYAGPGRAVNGSADRRSRRPVQDDAGLDIAAVGEPSAPAPQASAGPRVPPAGTDGTLPMRRGTGLAPRTGAMTTPPAAAAAPESAPPTLSRSWVWRLPLLLWLGWTGWRYLAEPDYWSIFSGIIFGSHEFGHLFFAPFGELLALAGGSLMQLLVPMGAAALLLARKDWFGTAVAGCWLSFSLSNLAVYIGDAVA